MQTLYGYYQDGEMGAGEARKSIRESIHTTYDIYLFLLQFPQSFHIFLESEKQAERSKYFPDKQIIRDCGMFKGNHVVLAIHEAALHEGRKEFKDSWDQHAEQFQSIFDEIRQLDFVRDYLVFDQPNRNQQVDFILEVFQWLINGSELFNQFMEEVYTSWYDDDKMIARAIAKTVSSLLERDEAELVPALDEKGEDMEFGLTLVYETAQKSKEYEGMISEGTQNWDPERIALLDLIMMKMALCEFLNFDQIPVKVSINEYLEIAKSYSTPNSAKFINGILDKLRIRLSERKAIVKTGRGLKESR